MILVIRDVLNDRQISTKLREISWHLVSKLCKLNNLLDSAEILSFWE